MNYSWDQFCHDFDRGISIWMLPLVVVGLGIGRFVVVRSLHTIANQYGLMQNIKKETKKNIIESIYYVGTIVLSMAIGLYTTWGAHWWKSPEDTFRGYPWEPLIDPYIKFYYTFATGFYIFWGGCVAFVDEKKKDFVAMLVHHIATLVVILLSALDGYYPIGCLIMLTFDVCDVWLESAKIANRVKAEKFATGFFVLFVLCWVKFRVYDYPFIVWTVWNGRQYHRIPSEGHFLEVDQILLTIILLLQWYWTIFIVKKLKSVLTKGIGADNGDPRDSTMKEFKKPKKAE
eukprot:TRINITY_DN2928_c0_g1_i1.p1 TRINITY_DN2928_c0_g1~~TRINITY_DN2928_c0_g1_i1.p1  ORF type:complete len:288 (+),score=66.13 TRINITY_DN2928_c0_g1_i1:48-911(+)